MRISDAFIARAPVAGEPPQSVPDAVWDAMGTDRGFELPDAERWSSEVGSDVSGARLVVGSSAERAAESIGARAFTVGNRVFFGSGRYAPQSSEGASLLRHELTHVAQQKGARVPDRSSLSFSSPTDATEREAAEHAGGSSTAVEPGPAVLSRDADPQRVASYEYYTTYAFRIHEGVRERLEQMKIPNPTPYTYWLWGRNDSFVGITVLEMSSGGDLQFWNAVGPEIHVAVNRGRDAAPDGFGPLEWKPEVAREVAGLVAPKIVASLHRLAPQYVAAQHRAWSKLGPEVRANTHDIKIPASWIVPSTAFDRYVIRGLRAGQLRVNWEKFHAEGGEKYAASHERKLNEVKKWSFEAGEGTWTWIRVEEPKDPSAEDVAALLYGDAGKAEHIVAAAPLFGFQPQFLGGGVRKKWLAKVGETVADSAAHGDYYQAKKDRERVSKGANPAIDPVQEMIRSGNDEASLSQARGFARTGANKNDILRRIGLCLRLLDSIQADIDSLDRFAPGPGLGAVRKRLEDRQKALAKAEPAETYRWDAHSAAQHAKLKQAANGVRNGAEQYRQFTGGGAEGGAKPELANHVRIPIYRAIRPYFLAAAASELPETAAALLAKADQQALLYPVEMTEGILRYCRAELQRVKSGKTSSSFYGEDADELAGQEQKLREQLFEVRELLPTDPASAKKRLAELLVAIFDFQDMVGLVGPLGTMIEEWNFLLEHGHTFWTLFTSKDDRYEAKMAVLEKWKQEYWGVYLDLKYASDAAGKKAAKEKLAKLRARGGELQKDIQQIAQLIEDEEGRERWLNLGARVAGMIGIAVVTMGVGAYVEGALLVGAGWELSAAGTFGALLISSGVEAATFTVATNVIFEQDPSISGALGQFVENWALFGALKGLGWAIEGVAAAGAAGASTKFGKTAWKAAGSAASLSTNLAANIGYSIFRADQEARKSGGQGLTEEQKRDLVIEGLAVFIGTMIAARYSRGFLESVRRSGESSWIARLATVDKLRVETLKSARSLQAGGSIDEIRALLARDGKTIQTQIEVLREMEGALRANPAKAQRLGVSPEALADLRALEQRALASRERASIGLDLEPVGGNVFVTAKFDEVVSRLERLGDKTRLGSDPATKQRLATVRTTEGKSMQIIEQAAGDNAAAGGERMGAPEPAEGSPRIREIDPNQLTEGERAVERWQTHGLETDPRARPFMADPEFREAYALWMEMPNRLGRGGRVNAPPGTSKRVRAMLQRVAGEGNFSLSNKAVRIAEKLSTEFPELRKLDPESAEWRAARTKLVRRFGERSVASYEESVSQRVGDPARAALDERLESILAPGALDVLRGAFSDCEIYVTGSATQTRKALTKVTDVDVIIVAPERTSYEARVAMEKRANGMRVASAPEYQQALREAGKEPVLTLEVDAKVMTPHEYAGWSMVRTPAGRTPLRNLRVDVERLADAAEGEPKPTPGLEHSGADVHSHLLGPLPPEYFVRKVGGGSAIKLFERIYNRFQADTKLRKAAADSWALAQETKARIDELRGRNASPEQIEMVANQANQKLLAASDKTSFNSAYEVRDELIKRHIDRGKYYENFIRDTIRGLAEEGVSYSEQSVSLNKLTKRIPPENQMRKMHEELAREGKDSDMRFLAMLNTETLAPERAATESRSAKDIQKAFRADLERLRSVLERGDVVGVDFAGPERFEFTTRGLRNFEQVYRMLRDAGRKRGRPLVLRPHVGEGFREGADSHHASTAMRNLESLIGKLEALGHTGNAAADGVIVRFGHATHVTPKLLIRMQRLGIYVEANLSSNLATGSIARIEEHPLLYNLYYDVPTIVSTDAQGVMGTKLPREFEKLRAMIAKFRRGELHLEIDGRAVSFAELGPTTKRRFSANTLLQWAENYRAQVRGGDLSDVGRTTRVTRPPSWRPPPRSEHEDRE